MDPQLWIAFVIAYGVVSIIPGPSVLMVLSQSLAGGRRAGLACVLGDLAGGIILMSAAFAGLGAALAAGSLAFQALKWAGIVWLIWLGLRQIAGARHSAAPPPPQAAGRAGFLTGVLNPKAIGFYLAFLPQFIDPACPALTQMLILMITASTVVGIVLGGYVLMAAKLARRLQSPRARRGVAFVGGGAMLGGASWMAITR